VRLQQERTHLVQQYSPEWPAVKELDAKIRTVQAQMSGNGQALYFSQRDIRNPAIDVLNNRLAALEVENKALNNQLVELQTQYEQAAKRVTQLRDADGQLHSLTLSRDVAEGVFRQLSQQQPNVSFQENTVDQRNANLRVVQPPTASVIGRSMALSYFFGSLFLGLLLGLAATAVASLLRQVYLMPDEAERELGLFDLGEFSLAGPRTALPEIQPDVASIAALLQETTVDGRRVAALQVVGVTHADGKARLTRALAAEIASGYGLRTLILDLQGDGNGQAKILDATVDAAASQAGPVKVAATSQPQLWVSLDAPQSVLGNPRSSIVGVRQVLDEMRQRYDVLLIVVSTESSAHIMLRFARMVDANIMVVRAEQTRGVAAAQLRDTILSAGGNILGFVFVGRKFYVPAWIYRWI
jgi:Mrp family chromosome partitioning ATPase